ncbi:SrtB family sortase [Bacillus pseudomycoides]|nr:SrtB family sortase [Bacillus pseudomycoides]
MSILIRKILLTIVIVVSISGIGFSLFSILKGTFEYQQSAKRYKEVEKIYEGESLQSNKTDQMLRMNKDYVGWIKVNDTKINYPVVKTQDNSFYLSHNFYKEKDRLGSIFMDYKNSGDQLDKNIILYGHNMKDASMFGSLKNFLDQDYYQSHRFISFDYLGSTYEWEIFSVYASDDVEWMKTQFSNYEDFGEYLTAIKKKSKFPSRVEVTNEDNILTLSTCTNREEDGRFIVHAKLIKKGND